MPPPVAGHTKAGKTGGVVCEDVKQRSDNFSDTQLRIITLLLCLNPFEIFSVSGNNACQPAAISAIHVAASQLPF
jgi:hypothetical protein